MDDECGALRVDKWLWVARLVKTRALGAEAVRGGRVQVNGRAIKPSKDVRPGDRLQITTGPVRRDVEVLGIAPRRGPASEAALLYRETAESAAAREEYAAQRRLGHELAAERGGRPTKRDRRRYEQSRRG
ncbi:RNA-binding S4 domain-containing protein [Baekduia soli]|uniref:RNA-binding S4 domain-containing protein n=1 Tax=Baekduia soli TaxID=496014 RepID=A0A5B8U9K8_9ACTN|nr:RNA-binding S4 domain-containing protein [Baekduia soli]QEC49705.1 RNA-binding S4 domain-containing protein [Baekduia soli]